MNKKVGIVKCPSYDTEEVYKAVKNSAEMAGYPDVEGKTVLMKPNILLDISPDKATTTHPAILEAAIRLVLELGAKRILVGDSPGMQKPGFQGKLSGHGEVTAKYGAEWVDFGSEKCELIFSAENRTRKFNITKAVLLADIIVNLPKLKTHQLMFYTGAMKNLFGLIPGLTKSTYHVTCPNREAFGTMLVDLCEAIEARKPVYSIMDAVVGMEGPGPMAGSPRQVGLIMASSNMLAIDIAATTIMAYPPFQIPTNSEALQRGKWLKDIEEIEYPGCIPADLRSPSYIKIPLKKNTSTLLGFILRGPLRRFRNLGIPGPEINHSVCIRCADCQRICASEVITAADAGKERYFIIDYKRCIRCYCCHEICPAKAIHIAKRPRNRQ